MTEPSKILSLSEVADLTRRALGGCGAHGQQLELAVQSVVDAECDGIRTVGLGYLPLYCGHLQVGKINRDAQPEHAQIAPSALRSMIVDSYSAGVVGWFVQRMAAAGIIGIGFANSPSAVAPAPGASPFFGTNPMAFAIPRGEKEPIIADMATSQVALVTIKKAAAEGRPIPAGWGYDKDGNDTTDAAAVINGGALAPAGGYKGMLLGLLVDLLAGVLSGPHCSFQAPVFKNNTGGEPKVGQFFIAISPGGMTPGGEPAYAERLETMLNALAAEPGVRLPGARRHESRLRAETEGVAVPIELLDRLEAFAASA